MPKQVPTYSTDSVHRVTIGQSERILRLLRAEKRR